MRLTIQVQCLLSILSLTLVRTAPVQNARPRLRVNNYHFRIAIFSDLHFGEDEDSFGIPQDANSTALMNYVLEIEQPDLAVLNGDLITGENTFGFNSTKYVDRIVAPLVARAIPWASTYGNHDSQINLTREGILKEELKYPGALTQHGPPETDGVTNYMLPIYGPDWWENSVEQPVALLHFFDSRGGVTGESGGVDAIPDWVSDRTSQWYRNSSAQAAKQWGTVPSFAFVHIPMRAFLELQGSTAANVSGSHYPGLNADVPLAQQGDGPQSEPFMQSLLDTPGLHSVYSGHDHGDSWCGRWPTTTLPGDTPSRPFLCFSKQSGFGGYGGWNRGVRILDLVYDYFGGLQVETWVRMQQGSKITAVSLNSTYGTDVYPTADGGHHPY